MIFLSPENWKPKIDSDEELEPYLSQISEENRSDEGTRKLLYFLSHFMNISEVESFNYVWALRSIQLLSHFPVLNNKPIKPTDFIEKGNEDHVIMGYEGWLIKNPNYLPQEMTKLKINENITINFYAVIPITEYEIEYAKRYGGRKLVSKYNRFGTDVTYITRNSVDLS
jgi:hypothetical protein